MRNAGIIKYIAALALCLCIVSGAAANDMPGLCCLEPIADAPTQRVVVQSGAGTGTEETTLTFEGLENLEHVQDFYSGGVGGDGSGPGPDYGIEFSANAQAIISQEAGGSGNFLNNPSGDTILFFLSGSAATMNMSSGFEDGFSFFYSAANNPGVIRVYDGLDGTGTVLAELNLPVTPTGSSSYTFDNWQPIGVEFNGVARSVDFGGTIDQIGFDNITPGDVIPGGAEPPSPPIQQSPLSVPIGSPFVWLILCTILLFTGISLVRGRKNV